MGPRLLAPENSCNLRDARGLCRAIEHSWHIDRQEDFDNPPSDNFAVTARSGAARSLGYGVLDRMSAYPTWHPRRREQVIPAPAPSGAIQFHRSYRQLILIYGLRIWQSGNSVFFVLWSV